MCGTKIKVVHTCKSVLILLLRTWSIMKCFILLGKLVFRHIYRIIQLEKSNVYVSVQASKFWRMLLSQFICVSFNADSVIQSPSVSDGLGSLRCVRMPLSA